MIQTDRTPAVRMQAPLPAQPQEDVQRLGVARPHRITHRPRLALFLDEAPRLFLTDTEAHQVADALALVRLPAAQPVAHGGHQFFANTPINSPS